MKQKKGPVLVLQALTVIWYKECRGAPYTVQRGQMAKAAMLPHNFWEYSCGLPVHSLVLWQKKDGFHIERNDKNIATFEKRNSIRLDPVEVIPDLDNGSCELRYRYDYHHGAMPERTKYDKNTGRYLPVNQSDLILEPGQYGRVISNGRFIDRDTGNWWYQLNIANVMILPEETALLDCLLVREPDQCIRHMEMLW